MDLRNVPDQIQDVFRSAFEFVLGTVLFSLPAWQHFLIDVGTVSEWLARVCGGLIGLHGVYQIARWYLVKRKDVR